MVDITYLGHAAFRIKGKNLVLITDPFDPSKVGLKFPKTSADVVTISHHHDDHDFIAGIGDYRRIIDGPGEYELVGTSIIGISTYHDSEKGKERGKNTIYVIEIDEIRICHLGDLGHKLSEKTVETIGAIDVLMIPVGGIYTIDSKIATEIVRDIEPKITIPMHYLMKGYSQSLEKLGSVDSFLSEVGMSVEQLGKLSIKRESLESDQKVVVLSP